MPAKTPKSTAPEATPTPASTPAPTTFKAFTVIRAPGGWSQLTLDVSVDHEGNATVTKVEASQPDVKPVAIEKFKIAGFKHWSSL